MSMEGTVQRIEVSADHKHVHKVALDMMSYPEWVTGVKEVEILEQDECGRPIRVFFRTDAMVKEISYTLLYSHEMEGGFSWKAESGEDINAMDGRYEFNELVGGSTEVLYALRVDPAFVVPGFLRRQAEKQIVASALRGLKRRSEAK